MFNWLKKSFGNEKPVSSFNRMFGQTAGRTLGQLGEEFAQNYYRNLNFKIIAANEFNRKGKRLGEIDFIAADKQSIIFAEVKTRRAGESRFGTAAESVNAFKQDKILKAAKMFFLRNPQYRHLRPQIDVCLVEFDAVDKVFRPVKIIANAVEDWN